MFAVVVNRAPGVLGLTTAQTARRLRQQTHELEPSRELGITSDDCTRDDDAAAVEYLRCGVGSAEELLIRVYEIDGAIGYAEFGGAREFVDVAAVTIDVVVPDASKVADRPYQFWEVEHA